MARQTEKPPGPGRDPTVAVEKLSEPRLKGPTSVEEALRGRRSTREYSDAPLNRDEVSQILWAAQGVVDSEGRRTAPSAGALYPLEVYLVAGRVDDLRAGIYKYRPADHVLVRVADGDKRPDLYRAGLEQEPLREAPVIVVFTAVYARTRGKYGDRSTRYVDMEAGHAAQNVCLEAVALGLGSVVMGAFEDDEIRQVLRLPAAEDPLYLIPVGRP